MHIPTLEPGITYLLRRMVNIPRTGKFGNVAVDFLKLTQVIVWLNLNRCFRYFASGSSNSLPSASWVNVSGVR